VAAALVLAIGVWPAHAPDDGPLGTRSKGSLPAPMSLRKRGHDETTAETQIWFMNVGAIERRATVDAWQDGGNALVGRPWSLMPH
jgi:hypothetical protein